MTTEKKQNATETVFQISLDGLSLEDSQRKAMETAIRRAVLLELAALDHSRAITVSPIGDAPEPEADAAPRQRIIMGMNIEVKETK